MSRDIGYTRKVSTIHHHLWGKRAPRLGRLDIELTERCNNNCIHCSINLPAEDAAVKKRELSTDQVKSILAQAVSLGALTVRFTGGEPLLRQDFAELYLFARRQGLKVLIFTNARLMTPDLAELLGRIPPLEKMEITVYGMCRESYEAVTRVKGSYEDFRQGVELLLAHRVPFVVKGVLLPQNKADVKAFEAWAARLPGMDNPPNYAMFYEFRGRRDSPAKNRLIESLRPPPHESATFLRRQGEVYLKEMRDFCGKFIGPPGDRLFACGAGRVPCVDAYGRLQACLSLRHPDTSYDLQSGSLQDALTMFFPRLREIKASNPEYLARCAHCFLKGLCEQCPAKSWTEHGTLDTPVDYLCRVAHAQARDLGLLKDAEQGWEVPNWRERIQWL